MKEFKKSINDILFRFDVPAQAVAEIDALIDDRIKMVGAGARWTADEIALGVAGTGKKVQVVHDAIMQTMVRSNFIDVKQVPEENGGVSYQYFACILLPDGVNWP